MGSLSDSTAVSLPKAQVDVEVGSQARRSVEGDGIGSGSGIGSELSGQEEEEEYERVGKARVHDEGSGLVPIPKKSRLIKTDRPRPFICGICTRGFARQEHLKRHERSHTNEKPFLCAFCGRCFARRDLVLRHQQKLHAALMDQDKNPDICSASKEMKQHYAERHIIRKPGNKETMLPTPGSQAAAAHEAAAHDATSGSDGSHQGDENGRALKDESPSLLQQQPKKRKRHASFSASTNVSYTQNKDVPQIIKGEMNGIPHQVGFSTPQLTAQELVDKALLSGIDVDSLMPPEFLLSDPSIPLNATNLFNGHLAQQALAVRDKHSLNGTNSSSTPHLLDSFSKTDQMHIDLDQVSKDFHQKQQFPPGLTPLISDLLTMRSSNAGVGGFVDLSVEQNLDYFNYKGSPKGSKRAKANKFGILEQPAPALEPVHNVPIDSNHENTSDLIHQFINNMESHDSDVNSRPANRDNSPMSVATRGGLLHDQQDNQQHHNPEEEHWLSEFINTEMDGNFKVNMSHFNEIGFPTTSASSQINSDPNSPVISQLSSNVNAVHRNQIPLRQKQSQVQSQPPQQQSFAGTYSMNSPMLVQNGSGSGSGSGSCSFNQSSSQTGTPLDISSLFKSRQVDLFKKIMDTNGISTPGISPNSVSNGLKPRKGTRLVFFDEALREKILSENNLLSTQFPTLQELNVYANLYQDEFHKYFPFIHLHSIKPSMEIYPLLLSICVIGALYGFHSSHAMLLFNITRFHIREYLERTKDYHDKTPLWVIQSMVLLIFLGIFNNDMTITQTMNTQIMSLIELVKLKQLNLPLENIMPLPIESDHIMEYQDNPELQDKIRKTYRTKEQMERNFQYFIKAQSRIRTCHTILIISNLFTSLVGLDCCFHSIDLKCGIPCHNEQLYLCENSAEWSEILMNDHVELDSKFSLIQLSNGGETYKNCLIYLTNGHQFFYDNKKVSFKTLLSLLISIHEKIFIERYNLKRETNIQIIEMKWRLTSRPIIESLLKFWEALYLKNGGILQPNDSNIQLINNNPALRLIIPLHSFAKMRKCISLTSVMNKIWLKDWHAMNVDLENSYSDWDSLREATDYGLNIVKFWIDTVAIVQNAEKTSIRTPIFSITCIFSAILTIAEFLKRVERKAFNWKHDQIQRDSDSTTAFMNYVDRTIWLKSEMILKKVETHLLPKGYNMQSYAEFLRLQANGALDVEVLDDELAKRAMDPNTHILETLQVVQKARLSSRSLYLGVRILGDAPIWPIALLFAHALQSRAIYNLSHMSTPTT